MIKPGLDIVERHAHLCTERTKSPASSSRVCERHFERLQGRLRQSDDGHMELRISSHTARLEELVVFYRDGLGLAELGRFDDHDG